jgi:poly-gamma-glutamate biosynthesis protein PgsC/CapC
MIITSFGLGIIMGFVFFEITGLTAGGIIVPGYVALYLNDPLRILVTITIAILTYGVIVGLSNIMILYGRRRFLMAILIGFLLRGAVDWFHFQIPEISLDLQAIGYIIPGLIANEFSRQGIIKTVMAMTIVSISVYLLLQLFF